MKTQKLIFEQWLKDFSHETLSREMNIDEAKNFIISIIKDYGYNVVLKTDNHVYGHPSLMNIPDVECLSVSDVCSVVSNFVSSKNRKLFGELHSPHYCRIYAETLSKISSVSLLNIVNSMIKSGLSVEDVVK